MSLVIYILAKNEAANIGLNLSVMSKLGCPIIVLDSGSEDETVKIASDFPNVQVVDFEYVNHCLAYNEITTQYVDEGEYAMILDADMRVDQQLFKEITEVISETGSEVIISPVSFWINNRPLKHGSMYPPKAIVFRGGREYFKPKGHGERLGSAVKSQMSSNFLVHDDRKNYLSYLATQYRYSKNFSERTDAKHLSWKDWIRLNSPLMLLISPLVSYVGRLGILSGKTGAIYALDRLIAEAIRYRQILAKRIDSENADGK